MSDRDLPQVYVLELACDGCDCPDTVIYAPNLAHAWDQALRIGGWRLRSGKLYCPSCAAGLGRRPQ